MNAEQVRKNEFVIKGLLNGVHRINAHITSKGQHGRIRLK